jgi:hypothetical protein
MYLCGSLFLRPGLPGFLGLLQNDHHAGDERYAYTLPPLLTPSGERLSPFGHADTDTHAHQPLDSYGDEYANGHQPLDSYGDEYANSHPYEALYAAGASSTLWGADLWGTEQRVTSHPRSGSRHPVDQKRRALGDH